MERQNVIKKSHIKAAEKFNEELNAWAKETGEEVSTLYEDAWTFFTLSDFRVENGYLCYKYDGREESYNMVREFEDGEVEEEWGMDDIMHTISFFRACLRRAKKYWAMDCDTLDRIQGGEQEEEEEDEND